jgi:hypothetical protein
MGRREVVKVQLDKAGVLRENVGQIGDLGLERSKDCLLIRRGFLVSASFLLSNESKSFEWGSKLKESAWLFLCERAARQVSKNEFTLSSSSIEFTIRDGRISSLVDLDSGRQLIAEGKTGGFVIFEDMPNYWSVSLLTVQLH